VPLNNIAIIQARWHVLLHLDNTLLTAYHILVANYEQKPKL